MKYLLTITIAALASFFIGSSTETEAKIIAEVDNKGLIYLAAEQKATDDEAVKALAELKKIRAKKKAAKAAKAKAAK